MKTKEVAREIGSSSRVLKLDYSDELTQVDFKPDPQTLLDLGGANEPMAIVQNEFPDR